MSEVLLLIPGKVSPQLRRMAEKAVGNMSVKSVTEASHLPDLQNKKLILAVQLDEAGFCIPFYEMITKLYERGRDALRGASGVLLIHSPNEFYTKSTATALLFRLNLLGCRFPGHPMVEALDGLNNFSTWQKVTNLPLEEICDNLCEKLGKRLHVYNPILIERPNIVALHASAKATSNTLSLWHMVKEHLSDCKIKELHVENGSVMDCKGCSFKTCTHFSSQNSCFYGGMVVEEIFPAVERADAVVWICPNYNDSLAANLTAVINRMTALYRKQAFYDKSLFGVIVSGNSGSDSVAQQLMGSLCLNKGFVLPPDCTLTANANDPGAIFSVPDIEEKAQAFARHMLREISV